MDLISKNNDYSYDTSNYCKILSFIRNKVEIKIREILPQPIRTKRGLINGLGSIFKAISGNLDYADGERYDKLIRELQNNQINLANNIKNQNTLSVALIDKFNNTIQQIRHNEKLLETRIYQISYFIKNQTFRENIIFIKDLMNQIINMYEILNSILQDIENSISFAQLQIMHPSIIKTADLFYELKRLQSYLNKDQFPVEVTLENMHLFLKLIKINSFILNNKITYILHVPITYFENFKYYHLFSIPIFFESQFKAIIPRNKFLAKNELHYAFLSNPCDEILPQRFICPKEDIKEVKEDNPCEIQLLDVKNTSACQKTQIKISRSLIRRLGDSNQWIALLPKQEILKLKCAKQEEIRKPIAGTYLIDLPIGCQISISQETIINEKQSTKLNQPVLFPDLDMKLVQETPRNITLHLDEIDLDDLKSIRTHIIENQPTLSYEAISNAPSFWTLAIYGLLVLGISYFCYKKIYPKLVNRRKEESKKENIDFTEVQLPR